MFPQVHSLAILVVVPLPIILSRANDFATGKTSCLLSHVPYMPLAFVFIVEDLLAYATIPSSPSFIE